MNFDQRMDLVCKAIPYGTVVSYGRIALLCGAPKSPRRVGYSLSHGLLEEDIPAHRIVNSQGVLSGAWAFEISQRKLLEQEGVKFLSEQRVNLKRHAWKTDSEDILAFEKLFKERGI